MSALIGLIFLLIVATFIGRLFGGPKQDRVELPPHIWQGNTLKPHYNRRFLGPIKIKTFLSTSKLMVKTVDEFSRIVTKLEELDSAGRQGIIDSDIDKKISLLLDKVIRYMRQIDRRKSLKCHKQWASAHPKSYSAYHSARSRALSLETRLDRIYKKHK